MCCSILVDTDIRKQKYHVYRTIIDDILFCELWGLFLKPTSCKCHKQCSEFHSFKISLNLWSSIPRGQMSHVAATVSYYHEIATVFSSDGQSQFICLRCTIQTHLSPMYCSNSFVSDVRSQFIAKGNPRSPKLIDPFLILTCLLTAPEGLSRTQVGWHDYENGIVSYFDL